MRKEKLRTVVTLGGEGLRTGGVAETESTYALSELLARLRSRPVARGVWFHYSSSGGLYMFKTSFCMATL